MIRQKNSSVEEEMGDEGNKFTVIFSLVFSSAVNAEMDENSRVGRWHA